jgi:mono/diheme cytochrome c family protein
MRLPGLVGLVLGIGCGSSDGAARFQDFHPGTAPTGLAQGERLYNTYCSSCHGYYGRGEGLGPPLLDTLYLPARLPDQAIRIAVEQGVSQRHWHYGAMPRVGRMGAAQVDQIIPYIRWLQQRAGIDTSARDMGNR